MFHLCKMPAWHVSIVDTRYITCDTILSRILKMPNLTSVSHKQIQQDQTKHILQISIDITHDNSLSLRYAQEYAHVLMHYEP